MARRQFWGESNGVGPGETRHHLTISPSLSAQRKSHSGSKDQPVASTPAPAEELEQHRELLSLVDLHGSGAFN